MRNSPLTVRWKHVRNTNKRLRRGPQEEFVLFGLGGLSRLPSFTVKNRKKGYSHMSIREKVILAYKKIGASSPRQIADYTKLDYKQVSGAVTHLHKQGKLERVDRGKYVYKWDESEKPQPTVEVQQDVQAEGSMILDVMTGEITREKQVSEKPSFNFEDFMNFLADHDLDLAVINEIEFLYDYYTKYVVR